MSVFGQDFTEKGWNDPDRFDAERQDTMKDMSDHKKKAKKRAAAKASGAEKTSAGVNRESSPDSDSRHDIERPFKKSRKRKNPFPSSSSKRKKENSNDDDGGFDNSQFEIAVQSTPRPMFPVRWNKRQQEERGGEEQNKKKRIPSSSLSSPEETGNHTHTHTAPVIKGIVPRRAILAEEFGDQDEEVVREGYVETGDNFNREDSSESVDLCLLAQGTIDVSGAPISLQAQEQQEPDHGANEADGDENGAEDDIVYYNSITEEANRLLGNDPDYIKDCIICELGIGNKNSQDLKPAIQQLSKLQNASANRTSISRAVQMASNYELLVRGPQNKIIQKMIDAKPQSREAILKERPFYRELTAKQAWWHYTRPHIKTDENYMVLKMEMFNAIQNSLKDECWMYNKKTGKRETNKESLDELRKWELMEVNLRKKPPTNPYFAGNPAATAIASAAISSQFPLQATVSVSTKISCRGLLDE